MTPVAFLFMDIFLAVPNDNKKARKRYISMCQPVVA